MTALAPTLLVASFGLVPYADALQLQRDAAQARITGILAHDLLMLLEHPPVVTLGRSTNRANLLVDAAALSERGVSLFEVERGGDITFHGPGQLVGYPIVDLRTHREDLHWYLRQIEEVLIRALASLGLVAERRARLTGVWTGGRKIASIGVHARNWVTWHGFALNVSTDLSHFAVMVPCGIDDVQMTSVAQELGVSDTDGAAALSLRVRSAVVGAFAEVFLLEPVPIDTGELRALTRESSGPELAAGTTAR